jgi:pyruvate dehydrogenase E2 component (dihydrolipoamide acetyltransferase)
MNQIVAITMPKWGLEMTEGTLAAWHLAEGAAAGKGVELADIETAKIVNTLELDGDGTVRRLVAKVGETLPVGALLAVVADPAIPETDIASFISSFKPAGVASAAPEPVAVAAPVVPVAAAPAGDLAARNEQAHATPLAKRVANELGVDLSTLTGTGRNGRISQEDVEAAAASRVAVPVVAVDDASVDATPMARKVAASLGVALGQVKGSGRNGKITQDDVEAVAASRGVVTPLPDAPVVVADEFEVIPLGSMRKAIAEALQKSKQTIPHFYLTMDVEVDRLLALREEMNARPGAAKLSVNDFVLRAAALALAEVPEVNVHYTEAGIKKFAAVGLGLAVAVEAGLIVPVIADAAKKSVGEIGAEAKILAGKARARSLTAGDLAGGTFTVSNLGMFGIRHFEAIINPPQGAILAVGASRREPREAPHGVAFISVMSVTLSCDHRAIDGAVGSKFLNAFKALVERPLRLVL